eukprot:TRINITY_DN373_c0_g1_i2.p1 TRINITY_DN373_c0_g1~~TRINITY_DN373_c0_g1_i2.p1  ORF type:complete len:551 (-),score=69.23 TRINITY_DN373_c0_g1_i2:4-1656(-)
MRNFNLWILCFIFFVIGVSGSVALESLVSRRSSEQVCPSVPTATSCVSSSSFGFNRACSTCNCYSNFGGRCCENTFANNNCTYAPFSLDNSNSPPYIITRTFESNILNIVVGLDAIPSNQKSASFALGLGSTPGGNRNITPCSCFEKGLTVVSRGNQSVCTDTYTIRAPWTQLRDCCSIIENTEVATVYRCDIDYSLTEATVLPDVTRDVTGSLPVQLSFPKQQTASNNSLEIVSDISELQAFLSRQIIYTLPNDVIAQISLTTRVGWPYTLTFSNLVFDPAIFEVINSTITTINPDTSLPAPCSTVGKSSCDQVLTLFIRRLSNQTCSFDGRYSFYFSSTCRDGSCQANQHNASIVTLVNTENFCPTFEIIIGLSGSINTYQTDLITVKKQFLVYSLPVTSGEPVCIKAYVSLPDNSTGQVISATYFNTIFVRDTAGMSSTILASQNGQPVECPNLPSGACSAANGANLIADTVLQPNVVVSDVNGAGACFYLTVTGSSGAGIVDDLSLAAQPWQIVAQAAITFANTKRGSEDPSITCLLYTSPSPRDS